MSLTYCNTLIKTCRVDWVRKFVSNACVACKCGGSLQKSARRVASIYSHTPVRSVEIWILFSPENIFIIKLGWLINFSHYISVFVLVFPLSFYYSITLEMGKINNWRTYWKISRGKRGKWHFRDPKLKHFLGEACLPKTCDRRRISGRRREATTWNTSAVRRLASQPH